MFRPRLVRFWRQPGPLCRSHGRLTSTQGKSALSRIDRVTARLPRPLQKYTTGLRNAPVSHVVSFLILHELTAILPLFALFGVFHYTNWVPVTWMTEHFGGYVQSGIGRFERYFARKGWFGFSREDLEGASGQRGKESQTQEAMDRYESGELKYKILVEIALAYAITKALLPIRIIASASATPWFARILVKSRALISRKP
ncbi:mitochondrial seryl-tRNA synthetase [Emericellopsis cladophorae]|uniref:Mitochondrial seryl-tRNA synthetase n=1 Tax=Emericellopsis cladophorae TaxID=2686198 RepID=A0A9Q0BH05_9HYPO|nr:mitochondrial seryl-tRNA synthetase [Emericellopsis cladophorae]KAI6785032.1 mitochondrial seryl-tRNA synthetase [Emericellopsis cladophorae]